MPIFAAVNSFNAGELSPKMIGRVDVSQYSRGCRKLRNFLATPYGAAERRPGTLYVAQVKNQTTSARLIPFVFSSDVTFLCEFGYAPNGYIRFYRNDALVYELAEAQFGPHISYVQSADVMFLCDGERPVRELKRTGENVFELSELEFTYPPVLDDNLTETTITPSAREGEITLTAGAAIFESNHVGGYWNIVHIRLENEIAHDFKKDGVSESIEVFGYWSFVSHGTWTGTLTIQRSFDNGTTWKDYRTYTSAKDSNASSSGEEETENVLYRLKMEDYEASSTGTVKYCQCVFSNPDFETTGVVRIETVVSATEATAQVIKKLGDVTATAEWNEGAWSEVRGFPRTVAFYEERLMFGGTDHQPNTVWGSRVNDWNNFKLGDLDDDGLSLTLVSDTVNHIRWMCQHDSLIIGTSDSEWTLSASSRDAALTPSNVKARRQSVYGSGFVPARMAGETVLFPQRQGRALREFVYSWEKEGYVSPDLTVLADHITASGIAETALQQQPRTLLWCRLNDGTLAVLTYEREQEVVCWQKLETAGTVHALAVLPGGSGEDAVYAVVGRTPADVRVIERFAPLEWEDGAIANAIYTDSSVRRKGTAITEVSGLIHLAGQTVRVLADGAEQPPRQVDASGTVTLDDPADTVCVGLEYTSLLSPMPFETDLQNGSSMLRRKAVAEVRIRVYDSIGGEARAGAGEWQEIISRSVSEDDVNAGIGPKSEIVRIATVSGYTDDMTVELRQSAPLPLCVSCLTAILDVVE